MRAVTETYTCDLPNCKAEITAKGFSGIPRGWVSLNCYVLQPPHIQANTGWLLDDADLRPSAAWKNLHFCSQAHAASWCREQSKVPLPPEPGELHEKEKQDGS